MNWKNSLLNNFPIFFFLKKWEALVMYPIRIHDKSLEQMASYILLAL